jgi:hypothetical protein
MREGHASRYAVAHATAVAAELPDGAAFDPFRDNVEALLALFARRLPPDEQAAAPDPYDDEGSPARTMVVALLAPRAAAAFASLPAEMQEVLVVTLNLESGPYAGLTQAAYCRHRDLTPSRLRTLRQRALEQLRDAFAPARPGKG